MACRPTSTSRPSCSRKEGEIIVKKGILIVIAIFTFILTIFLNVYASDNALITDGAYVQLGKYDSEPIL